MQAGLLPHRNWAEFRSLRGYLSRHDDGSVVVSGTEASLPYGTQLRFRDLSGLLLDADTDSLTTILSRNGVTHLVVTERHTLFEFPSLRPLLDSPDDNRWSDLVPDTVITAPRRVVLFRVSGSQPD